MYENCLNIITICKDDIDGLTATVNSTHSLRNGYNVRQTVVFSSSGDGDATIDYLADNNSNLSIHYQAPAGIAAAFNYGLSQASSDWVWFLNSKDEVHPSLDPEFLMKIISGTKADVILFEIEYLQSARGIRHPPLSELWPPMNWIPHPSAIIRRDLFDRHGYFDSSYEIAMDSDFWVRLFTGNVVADLISIPVVRYDQTGISSREFARSRQEDARIVRNNLFKIVRPLIASFARIVKKCL